MAETTIENGAGTGTGEAEAAAAAAKAAADAAAAGGSGGGDGATDFAKLVPTEYKDAEYLKDVKDTKQLFAKLDGAQKLIGQRPAGIPQDNAPEADWQKFNKAFGVPEKAADYALTPVKENPMPEPMLNGVKEVFHKAGLSKRQASMVEKGWNELMGKQMQEMGITAQKQDVDFEKLAGETFGADKDKALETSKALMEKYAPANMKAHINSMSNENLILLAGVIDGIRKDFIAEDKLPNFKKGGSGPMNDEQKRARGRELMASEAYTNGLHKDHDKVVAEVQQIYRNSKA